MFALQQLGWNSDWDAAFEPFRKNGWIPARVAVESKNYYFVFTERGEFLATVSGKMLHKRRNQDLPKVGDWAAVTLMGEEGKAIIHALLPRRSTLARKTPGREVDEQVLAVNVDTAFVVQALDASFNVRRLERFLVMVHDGGVHPMVLLNKTDLCENLAARLADAKAVAGEAQVMKVCALTGKGIKALIPFFQEGKTGVFLGPSGVGKSSIINRLYGEEIQDTIEVRERDAKGRHTTSCRELIVLPKGGLVIDSPGVRELHNWMAEDGLAEAFPDIEAMALGCHFRDCSHTVEKRCGVLLALSEGRLEASRLESFLKLKRERDSLSATRKHHTYMPRKGATVRMSRRG